MSFALNYDWGRQQQRAGPDLDWAGLAAYVNYALNARWRFSVRAEYLDDKDGFNTATPQKLKEGTVTWASRQGRVLGIRRSAVEQRHAGSWRCLILNAVLTRRATAPVP